MGAESYLIGAGRVFFDDGNGFLDIGNLPAINYTRENTTLEHNAVVNGERLVDLTLVTLQKLGISFTFDEFNEENLNLLMMGNGVTAANQTGATIVDEVATAPVKLDRSIFTAETNISAVTITNSAGTTTYVAGTDYEIVNATTGEIKILSTGSITGAESLKIDYTSAARNRKKIVPGKDLQITGRARIEIDAVNGKPQTWHIQNAALRVEGDTAISAENFSEATVILDILVDKTVTPSEPYGKVLVG